MKFRIHFEHKDKSEDSFDVEGDTLEVIRMKAGRELFQRAGLDVSAWSEELVSE